MSHQAQQFPIDRRVGDLERAATGETLSEALAVGQLSAAEFDERMSAALSARTRSELSALTVDLAEPGVPATKPHAASHSLTVELPVNATKSVAFAAGLGVVSFFIAQLLYGFTLEAGSLGFWFCTWLFGMICAGVGSLLTRKGHRD